jgi:hypothetical protein
MIKLEVHSATSGLTAWLWIELETPVYWTLDVTVSAWAIELKAETTRAKAPMANTSRKKSLLFHDTCGVS